MSAEPRRDYPMAAEVVKIEMVRCGYTAETLSVKTGISGTVLRGILTGRTCAISTRNLYALASAFGYSMADFLDLAAGNAPAASPE